MNKYPHLLMCILWRKWATHWNSLLLMKVTPLNSISKQSVPRQDEEGRERWCEVFCKNVSYIGKIICLLRATCQVNNGDHLYWTDNHIWTEKVSQIKGLCRRFQSKMATSLVNGGGTADQTTKNIHVLRVLERGLVLNRFYSRRRPEKRMFQIKLETRQLIWIRVAGGRPEGIGEYHTAHSDTLCLWVWLSLAVPVAQESD